jgi:gluconolactonase
VALAVGIGAGPSGCAASRDGAEFAGDDVADAGSDATTEAGLDAASEADAPVAEEQETDFDGPTDAPDAGPQYPPLRLSDLGPPVRISGQFLFTEGPIWDPAKQVLYFSDINGSTIYQLTLPDTIAPFLTPTQNANGLALDPQGRLIVAGFASRSVERVAGSSLQAIAKSYQGMPLNSPDDIIARSDGVIYFTDPTFGIDGSQGLAKQTQDLSFEGVYRLTTDGTVHLEDKSMTTPNGVELSPDERTLYVSFTTPGTIQEYSVAADGSLGSPESFASNVPLADSMCVDAAGNVYVASLDGVMVFDPSGGALGSIVCTIPAVAPDGAPTIAAQIPTNCAFGGPDQKTLFITARSALGGTPVAGNASLFRVDDMPIPGLPGRP